MAGKLEALGAPPDALLARLRALESDPAFAAAFADVMGAELCLAEIDLDIEFLDPCFLPIASVGNGDHYGLFLYPPLQKGRAPEVPVVQFWHEGPCVELEAASVADWIARAIAGERGEKRTRRAAAAASLVERELGLAGRRPAKPAGRWRDLLPTERRIERLRPARLAAWLLEACPPAARSLHSWEREWAAWWVSGHGEAVEREALIDHGLEAYRALRWKLPLEVLRAEARFAGVRPAGRPAREIALWSQVHRPSRADVGAVVRALAAGDARATAIVARWAEDLGWSRVHLAPPLRADRAALGNALVAGLAGVDAPAGRRRIERALLAFEYEEGLDALTGAGASARIIAALAGARASHAKDGDAMRDANDWSDVW